jgi:V-type H+-transporting ATPase subunit H
MSEQIATLLSKNSLVITHEDIVRSTAEKVLEQVIPWDGYHRANLILERELELIKKYDKKSQDVRAGLIDKAGETYAELFLDLLVKINKEETLQYLLTLIDNLLREKPESVNLFFKLSAKNPSYPFQPFMSLLNRSNLDWYTNSRASSVIATLMSSGLPVSDENVNFACHWLREQLRKSEEKDICNSLSALQKLLTNDNFRKPFAKEEGLNLLGTLLKSKMGSTKAIQICYQVVFCLWLLSYNREVAEQMNQAHIIPSLAEVLKLVSNDKVVRMTIATLRNLLNISTNNEQMIDANIMKPLLTLSQKNWADPDIVEDLEMIKEGLERNLVVLSSFDMYKKEVLSGNLEWSPVHRSEKFWKENSHKLEEDNHKLLLVLKGLLSDGADRAASPAVQAIACFDIGEFARFHPRGRIIVQQLHIKLPLMKLMEDPDPEVRKHALLAIQKLMVTNWEYLTH